MRRNRAALVLFGLVGLAIAVLAITPIIVVALPFWLVAGLMRTVLPLFRPPVVQWPDLFTFDPKRGWKAKSNFSAYCVEERDDVFQISTGSDGWPGKQTLAQSHVVVFGDSHAFGYGVDTERAFFELTTVPLKSIGAPGYNMVQELLLIEELAPLLKGKMVVWFVYYGNDLYDNLSPEMGGYRTPFVAQGAEGRWEIITRHIKPAKWSCSSGRQGRQRHRIPQRFFRRSFLGDRAFAACEFLIQRGQEICASAGAELYVMTVPTPAMLDSFPTVHEEPVHAGHPDDMITAICKRLNVRFVCLRDFLHRRDYKQWDEHWNEQGHKKVARLISDLYHNHVEACSARDGRVSVSKRTAVQHPSLAS